MERTVVFTADDFGVSEAANRAIATAHTDGVLTSASIMVCEGAAAHAASLAADLPGLGIGLHLTLSDGRGSLSHAHARRLVGSNGRFPRTPLVAGLRYWFARDLRPAIKREIVSQFDRCERLGLTLDHADGHQHLHVHPVIWDELVEECRDRGVRWIRLPYEEWPPSVGKPRPPMARGVEWAAFRALAGRCRRVAASRGVSSADRVIGHFWTGAMSEQRILYALARIGTGVTEIYSHPGAIGAELSALVSPRVRAAITDSGLRIASFGELPTRPQEGGKHGAIG